MKQKQSEWLKQLRYAKYPDATHIKLLDIYSNINSSKIDGVEIEVNYGSVGMWTSCSIKDFPYDGDKFFEIEDGKINLIVDEGSGIDFVPNMPKFAKTIVFKFDDWYKEYKKYRDGQYANHKPVNKYIDKYHKFINGIEFAPNDYKGRINYGASDKQSASDIALFVLRMHYMGWDGCCYNSYFDNDLNLILNDNGKWISHKQWMENRN